MNVCAAAARGETALPLRLIVQRKTPEATEATRLALRRAAIKKGKKLDPRSLIAAEFMIVVTSLPGKGYTAKDILAVYRLRWQIELAFKRLKSLLHIDKLPTRTEADVAKLALCPPHSGAVVRRPQPGFPGIFPLRSFSTPPTSPRFGLCGRWRFWRCSPSFSDRCQSTISSWRDRRFTARWPMRRVSESHTSDIRSGAYFSAYGGEGRMARVRGLWLITSSKSMPVGLYGR